MEKVINKALGKASYLSINSGEVWGVGYDSMENKEGSPMTSRERYIAAHRHYQSIQYPSAFKNFGPISTNVPDVRKANGLTQFVVNFLIWSGHRATRISSAGRVIDAPQKQQSGISLMTKKFIPGPTRKGSADISSTISGRSVMWEIKAGRDNPSEHQLREQALEIKAGGLYFFTHTPDEFFEQYDSIVVSLDPNQASLL